MLTNLIRPGQASWAWRTLLVFSLSQASLAMDLESAFEAAQGQDSGIRAARAAAEAGREHLPQSRSQWLPNVSFSAARNKNNLNAVAPDALGNVQDSQSKYYSQDQNLTLRQALYNKTKFADYQQAGFQVSDAEATLAVEMQNLTTRVSAAYFGALLAENQVDLLISQESLALTQLDAAKKSLAAGSGTRTDIDEVQARLDLNVAQLLEARQDMDYTRQQLSVMISQPVNQLAPLDSKRLDFTPLKPAELAQWQDLAMQASPEIKVLEARAEVARLQIEKNQAGHLPTLDMVVQWSISDSENVTRLNSNFDTKSIGLQLSMPLYQGGYVNSTIRQALAEHSRAKELLESTRRDLGLRVHKEFRGVTEGVLRVKALEQAVRSADQAVISSSKSVQAGIRTQLDVLKAESLKMESMRDLAKARYDYLLSKLRLTVLAGYKGYDSIHEINGYLGASQSMAALAQVHLAGPRYREAVADYDLGSQGAKVDVAWRNGELILSAAPSAMPSIEAKAELPHRAEPPKKVAATDKTEVAVLLNRLPSARLAGLINVSVPREMQGFSFLLPAGVADDKPVRVHGGVCGKCVPWWLKFNQQTKVFTATKVPKGALPIHVVITAGGLNSTLVISEFTLSEVPVARVTNTVGNVARSLNYGYRMLSQWAQFSVLCAGVRPPK